MGSACQSTETSASLTPQRSSSSASRCQKSKPDCIRSTACEGARRTKAYVLTSPEWTSSLVDSSGKPVMLLKVQGAPGSKSQSPVIKEGQPIVGGVKLDFSKPEYVEEVVVTVSFYDQDML